MEGETASVINSRGPRGVTSPEDATPAAQGRKKVQVSYLSSLAHTQNPSIDLTLREQGPRGQLPAGGEGAPGVQRKVAEQRASINQAPRRGLNRGPQDWVSGEEDSQQRRSLESIRLSIDQQAQAQRASREAGFLSDQVLQDAE